MGAAQLKASPHRGDGAGETRENERRIEMARTPAKHRQPWAPQDNQQLRQLVKGNTPTRVIGRKMGRTPAAVQAQAGKQGVSLKPTNQSPYNRRKNK